ncbi:hypothetical protein [Rhodococcus sp. ACT016]|uniref:hypothetical protein n=1 Tax=Rhodococcus sp. ACT016 TaxID=3134808 RepID=UPI003D2E053F
MTFVVATSWLLLTAPGQVPSHFEGSGEITEWMGLGQYVAITSAFVLGTSLVCGGVRWYILKIPESVLNLTGPRQNYWARPENRHEFNTRIIADVERTGAFLTLTVVGVTILSSINASGVQVPFWIMPTVTVFLLLLAPGYAGFVVYSGRYSPPLPPSRYP